MTDMKRLTLMAMLVMGMTANAQNIGYEVSGVMPDSIAKVYMFTSKWTMKDGMPHSSYNMIDSVAVSHGQFVLKGMAERNAECQVGVPGTQLDIGVFLDGTPLHLNFLTNEMKGSPENEKLFALKKTVHENNRKWLDISTKLYLAKDDKEKTDSLKAINDELAKEKNAIEMKAYSENKNTLIGLYFLGSVAYQLSDEELTEALSPMRMYHGHPLLKKAAEELSKRNAKKAKRHVGEMFIDVEMGDTDGKQHRLSEWVGKGGYVLVDFWASWCGPCRAEMPNVLENYNRYKDSGFNVVGISLDSNREAWLQSVKKLALPFPQLSELKGWKGEYHKNYGINAIPANLLIGPDGKIIACDLRSEQLTETLRKIFE